MAKGTGLWLGLAALGLHLGTGGFLVAWILCNGLFLNWHAGERVPYLRNCSVACAVVGTAATVLWFIRFSRGNAALGILLAILSLPSVLVGGFAALEISSEMRVRQQPPPYKPPADGPDRQQPGR